MHDHRQDIKMAPLIIIIFVLSIYSGQDYTVKKSPWITRGALSGLILASVVFILITVIPILIIMRRAKRNRPGTDEQDERVMYCTAYRKYFLSQA